MARTTTQTDRPPRATRAKAAKGAKAKKATRRRAPARGAGRKASSAGAGKKLVIVESPAKARTINRYLGGDYVVKASMGHVRDLPGKQLGVDLEGDFAPTYELLGGRKRVVAELRKIAASAPEVYLATDLDREGEAIAWHLAEALGVPAERLRRVVFNEITASAIAAAFAAPGAIDAHKVDAQQARRILDRIVGYQVSPLLWKKVATGLSAGRVQTVAVRLIVERERAIEAFQPEEFWKIAAILTPDAGAAPGLEDRWNAFRAQAEAGARKPGGRNGGPTQADQLAFLAEHGAFRAELVEWDGQRFRCDDPERAGELAKALGMIIERTDRQADPTGKGPAANRVTVAGRVDRDADVPCTIRSLDSRTATSRAAPPFTTASMQQAASVRLRFSASRTMRVAQGLYEGVEIPGTGSVGLITYMRTDSVNLAPQAVEQARAFIGETFGERYLPGKPVRFRSGPRAQAAHEAVRPTDVTRTPQSVAGALNADQLKLYTLIWQRFVACQMAPAEWKVAEAAIVARTALGEALFKAVGRQLVFDGHLKVTGMPRQAEQILPDLAEAQTLGVAALLPSQHFTQAPPRYTEASLVKALEAEGIGRPSTYAAIIQTIQDREYVQQIDRRFHATELGMKVTDKLVKHFPDIFDIRFTARMEDQLDEVEASRADWVGVLKEFYGPFKADLERAAEEMVHAKAETEPSDYTCPACGQAMVYRWSKTGRYLACTGYPDCRTTFPVDREGKKIEPKVTDVKCPECGKAMILRRGRFGMFLGCSGYPDCKGTQPCDDDGKPLRVVKEEDIKESCPECGAPMQVKRKGRRAFLGCSRYPDCQTTTPLPPGIRLASPPKKPAEDIGVKCPRCKKAALVIREGRRGRFIACSGYPRCRNTYDIAHLDDIKAGKFPEKD